MKKSFLYTVLLIAIGNSIITIAEKYLYSKEDLLQLQSSLLNNTTIGSVGYPINLLCTKMLIWLTTFIVLAVLLFIIKAPHKKIIRLSLLLFYLLGCLVNVLTVPHPIWFIVAIIPIVIVPFIVVENILQAALSFNNYNTSIPQHRKKEYYEINIG